MVVEEGAPGLWSSVRSMPPSPISRRCTCGAQGAWGLADGLALILAPVLGTAVFAVSPTALWLSCGVLGLIAATLVLGIGPRRAVKPV